MEGIGLGLSHGFRLRAMARYGVAVNRYGAWGRTVAALIMIFAAGLFASPAWRVVQLLPLVVGLALAWINAYPEAVDPGPESRSFRRWLAIHAGDLTTAAPNLAGLFEGFGVVAAGLLFAGPVPVSMPQNVRIVALVAVTGFGWNAFSQVVADPGYYNMDPVPARWTIAVRWILPAAAALAALAILIAPGPGENAVPLWFAVLLASSLLLIWPYVATLNLLLRCAAGSADEEVSNNLTLQRWIHEEYVHRAKNELRPEVRRTSSDAEYDAFSAAVVVVQNALRDIAASSRADYDEAHDATELWETYRRTIGDNQLRDRLRFVDHIAGRRLAHMEGLILQSIFVGLVSNALRVRPQEVAVTVSDDADDRGVPLIRVVVEDDGAGGAPLVFEKGTGMARLDELCRQRGGTVQIARREGGGTQAVATFSYPYRLMEKADERSLIGGNGR